MKDKLTTTLAKVSDDVLAELQAELDRREDARQAQIKEERKANYEADKARVAAKSADDAQRTAAEKLAKSERLARADAQKDETPLSWIVAEISRLSAAVAMLTTQAGAVK